MPTYEYECSRCGKVFEEFQSITAQPLSKCPVEGCGGSVRRLLSAGAGFLFKGSGFYTTDYRSEAYKQKAKADSGASDSSGSKDTSSASSGSDSSSDSSSSSTKSESPKPD